MTTTQTTSFLSASFLNLFGIAICVVLCLLFLILGGHTLKYIKEFAVKIKIIANRAQDKNINLKEFNYKARETITNNESYQKWETIFKNDIKKSRSLQFSNILGSLLHKYDHILYYPFRDRSMDKYDLLKPKTSFYTWLVVLSCCISWMTTIFLSAILQSVYSVIDSIPTGVYVAVTVGIAFISSIWNIICISRLFRLYCLNVKGAFKVDYGHNFVGMQSALGEYEPEDSIEEENFLRAQDKMLSKYEAANQEQNGLLNPDVFKQREDTYNLNSTRKLLGEEFERSDLKNSLRQNQAPIIKEVIEEQLDDGPYQQPSAYSTQKKYRPIKEIFDLQVPIEGVDVADAEEKYIFIEDKHAIGDMDLLENEAMKGENHSNSTTFLVLFLVIALASAICCYLNYQFPTLLANYVFYMFIGAWIGDLIATRVLLIVILALLKYCKGKSRGYRKIQYKQPKEIKSLLNNAIKQMFSKQKDNHDKRGQHSKQNSVDQLNSSNPKQNTKTKGFDSDNNYTSNDRHDTSMNKQVHYQNDKEDQYALEINDSKKDDDQDGSKVPIDDLQTKFGDLGSLIRPQLQDAQKNPFENTQVNAFHTQIPLLSNLTKAIQEKQDEEHEQIMEKKQLVNELVDYNLLLLRKIYDAYEERADKVLTHFRTDKRSILRKRYMVPILNPNYDYERFLQEMKEKGLKDKEEENSVHLDGVTVCEDYEKQLMDAIIQEASDDLVSKKLDRQKIDKFGNAIDEDAQKNGISKATPQPDFGYIEQEAEENIIEDDEEARKRAQLEDLRRRLANGEQLTEEELALLYQLEQERLNEIEKRIAELLQKGLNNLSNDEKLELIDLKCEKLNIEKDRICRKKALTDSDKNRLGEIADELKKLEYEKLQLLKKMGKLTKEQQYRLNQLEEEFNNQELMDLRKKLMDGSITEEEMKRLLELLKQSGVELSEDEQKRLREMMKKFGLLEQEEMDKDMIQELLDKLHNGSLEKEGCIKLREFEKQYDLKFTDEEEKMLKQLERKYGLLNQNDMDRADIEELLRKLNDDNDTLNKEELLKLLQFEKQYGLEFTDDEKKKIYDLRKQFGMLSQDELDRDELEELMRKLRDGTLSAEELKRLQELMNKLGLSLSDEDADKLYDQRKKLGLLTQEELDMEELEELRRKLLSGEITEDELKRLMELQNKYGVPFSDEELDKLREAEERLGFNDMDQSRNTEKEENFSELPPVVVMNRTDSPKSLMKGSPEKAAESPLKSQNDLENIGLQNEEMLSQNMNGNNAQDLQNLQNPFEQNLQNQDHNLQDLDSSQFNNLPLQMEDQNELFGEQNQLNNLHQQQMLQQQKNQELEFNEDNIQNNQNDQRRDSEQTPLGSINQDNEFTMSPQQKYDEIQFGRDDLDPIQDESIYSHKTTTILDEEKVSFMHIEHLPNQDNQSEDSFDEQDMVYYNKDDLTNYSKGLGLNKVKAKQTPSPGMKNSKNQNQMAKYYSENDLHEVQESEMSDNDRSRLSGSRQYNNKARSAMSYDSSAERQRLPMSRGQINHNQLTPEDHSDLIDGRVKVDSWNLNYQGKKKKNRKRKVTKDQKRKMASLQEIYGIDAKTLAGLSKGRLPRKLLASGKLKGDENTQGFGNSHYQTDASFRSTQNTFHPTNQFSTNAKGKMRESVNDNQSNMFSFGGTRQGWNKGNTNKGNNMRGSKMENISEFDENNPKRFQHQNKLTATQQNFGKNGKNKNNQFMEEESKSNGSGSRNGSIGRRFNNNFNNGPSNKEGYKSKNGQNNGKGGNRRSSQSSGMDSHAESDEAVDDKGAMFQKRNYPINGKGYKHQKKGNRRMNDEQLDHSESEEGLNNDNPNFTGNEFMFKKRSFGEESKLKNSSKNNKQSNGKGQTNPSGSNRGGHGSSNSRGGRNGSMNSRNGRGNNRRTGSGSSGRLELEDLEAQQISGQKGRQATNKKNTNQKRQVDSRERDDSEEENMGGLVNFQKDSRAGFNETNSFIQKSNKKPPISGQRARRGNSRENDEENLAELNSIYGDPYNINGKIHPGVGKQFRNGQQQYSDVSDNERVMRGTNYNPLTDGEDHQHQQQLFSASKKNYQSQSNPNILGQKSGNNKIQKSHNKRQNRSINGIGIQNTDEEDDEDEGEFIVGPESNHSMIKPKHNRLRGSQQTDEEDDQYLLLQRERQIMEDLENNKNENSRLAKKRKIRKAAQSHNTRDLQQRRVEEMQNQRLQKKKREAENALFANEDDLEKGHAKMKKKKVKKDQIKKEINYWLDYDSPYAEYLVARFREWSPNPNLRAGSSVSQNRQNKEHSQKMKEVKNVYEHNNSRQGSSKQHSRSPDRVGGPAQNKSQFRNTSSMLNQKNLGEKKNSTSQQQQFLQVSNSNMNRLFVDDFEEP